MSEQEPRPTGVAIASAVLGTIPAVGGPIQKLFDELYRGRQHRVAATASEIAEAVGQEQVMSRLLEDPRLEALMGEALEESARTGFEAKRRLLARSVVLAFTDDAELDSAVLIVGALSLLEPVHVRSLIRLETAIAKAEPDDLEEAIRQFNTSEPTPVLATLENSGVIIRGTFVGGGFGAHDISNFGRYVLAELRAVADEEMERLAE